MKAATWNVKTTRSYHRSDETGQRLYHYTHFHMHDAEHDIIVEAIAKCIEWA